MQILHDYRLEHVNMCNMQTDALDFISFTIHHFWQALDSTITD